MTSRLRRTLNLALPIMGGMISQNIMNMVDTAMLGALGDEALASVGLAQFSTFTCGAFIIGLATGVQATSARWLGAGRLSEVAVPLNGGLLLVLVLSLPTSALLVHLAPTLFAILGQDPAVTAHGTVYFQARLVGLLAMGTNFVFRSYWNAVNLSKFYMRTIILMNLTNIFLNWVLIFGNLGAPRLGVLGAGIGTTTALYVGSAAYLLTALRHARAGGFLARWPDRATLLILVRLSLPACIQHVFFAAGLLAFFWILGNIGTAELAAGHVLSNVLLLLFLLTNGFSMAAASFVGQSLGAGKVAEARAWGWYVARLSMLLVGGLALPLLFAPDLILLLFLHDPETLALARLPLQLSAAATSIEAFGSVLISAHYGAGHSRRVMVVSLTLQWCLFLPIAFAMQAVWGCGLLAIWIVRIVYRILQTVIFVWSWQTGGWTRVRV